MEARLAIWSRNWTKPTAGLVPGYVQANLAILRRAEAFDFLRFCLRNSKSCPILDVTDPGSARPDEYWASDADLRTDVPRYRIFKEGRAKDDLEDLTACWREDLVAFLSGCSFTFEHALFETGVPARHLELGSNALMYRTNRPCPPAGIFKGRLVVNMRPIPKDLIGRAMEITSRFRLDADLAGA